jgi:hypothetical protein
MSAHAFKDLARPLLNVDDAALLDMVSLDPQPPKPGKAEAGFSYAESPPPCGSDFIDGWREWERTLRLNLAKQRSVHFKKEGAGMSDPPVFPAEAAAAAVKAVMGVESPLEGEILLNKARWGAIEVLQKNNYFDRDTIYAYLLKLMLLERHALFETEAGFSEYKLLYASIMESARLVTTIAGESK